jgi:hypothetical protein
VSNVRHCPLHITAKIRRTIALPNGPVSLDGLLARVIVDRIGATACAPTDPGWIPTEELLARIPIALEPTHGFALCTSSHCRVVGHENHWVNRRFPVDVAQQIRCDIKRINITAGAQKSYRLPLDTVFLQDGLIEWWCIGGLEPILDLLLEVAYLGKRRGVGVGAVVTGSWRVDQCEPWGDGFPLVREGQPMRPLPPDWPGLASGVETAYRTMVPPYHDRTREVLCAVPRWV